MKTKNSVGTRVVHFVSRIFQAALVSLPLCVSAGNVTGLGSPELDRFIKDKMWQLRTPGLAVLVVKDGAVIWSKGYGAANLEQNVPVTSDTPFHLASVSKTVVATAVMQLWERGEFKLDDDINGYLPFPVRNPNFPDAPITFRMLLAHDASIISPEGDRFPITWGMDSPVTLEDWLRSYLVPGGDRYDPVLNFHTFPPGAEFDYCNIGYGLLGYLVERLSGVPFDQYCNANLFAPLGMTDTSWRLADFFAWNVFPAVPYGFSQTTQSYFAFGYNGSDNYPSGWLNAPASQLAKFLIAHMNGGESGGVRLLQPETVALMQTVVHPNALGLGYGYGLGFDIWERQVGERHLAIGHGGFWYGAATEMWFRPEQRVGVILLANAAGAILTAAGITDVVGREETTVFVMSRLLDEAAAMP